MSTNYNPQIVTSGLVLCLDAANPKSYPGSGNTWIDLSGNNNSSNLANTPVYNTANGSFSFNGGTTDQYIFGTMPTIAAGSNVTTEAVIKLNTITGTKNIFTQGRSAVTFGYGMMINGSSFRFRNSSNDYILSSPTSLTTGVWYHLVLSSTATETTGYINGVSQGTTANVVTNNAITDYHISRRASNSASEYMNGEIALVRVYYNKALTQDEVLQNFNAIRGRYGI